MIRLRLVIDDVAQLVTGDPVALGGNIDGGVNFEQIVSLTKMIRFGKLVSLRDSLE